MGYEVVSVDNDPKYHADKIVDVLHWDWKRRTFCCSTRPGRNSRPSRDLRAFFAAAGVADTRVQKTTQEYADRDQK